MKKYSDRLRIKLSRLLPDAWAKKSSLVSPISERLDRARNSFLQGYHDALFTHPDSLSLLLIDLPPEIRGFALEGAAMAVVLIDDLHKSFEGLFAALLEDRIEAEQILCAIGAGCASARLRKSLSWRPKGIENNAHSAIIDGYGFYEGFFNSNNFNRTLIFNERIEFEKFFDVGQGRALWFVSEGNIVLILKVLESLSNDRKGSFWRGLGVACSFTGNGEFADSLIDVAEEYERHLLKGLDTGTHLLSSLSQSSKFLNYG